MVQLAWVGDAIRTSNHALVVSVNPLVMLPYPNIALSHLFEDI